MDPLLVTVAGLAVVAYIVLTWDILMLDFEVGTNDSTIATETFIKLVNSADRSLLICDDGNRMEGSIYENESVVEAVQKRLRDNAALCVYCMFSSDDDTLFRRVFRGNDRVKVKVVKPRRQIHFKIVDGGRYGYVSAHSQGSDERNYRRYNCSRTSQRFRERVFGHHIRSMSNVFPEAEVA